MGFIGQTSPNAVRALQRLRNLLLLIASGCLTPASLA